MQLLYFMAHQANKSSSNEIKYHQSIRLSNHIFSILNFMLEVAIVRITEHSPLSICYGSVK